MNGLKILKGLMMCLALMFIIGATYTAVSAATVTTDKPDYAPGEVVIITGTGWMPGETVSMILHEESQLSEPDVTLLSEADADGNIINATWAPDANDIGLTFTLTATGLSSGLTAQTMFTDDPAPKDSCPSGQSPDASCVTTKTDGICIWGCRNSGADGGNCTANSVYVTAGTVCDDGNLCTTGETCDGNGACTGGTPVVCTALDQCHVAGTCDPSTGQCSNPYAAAGTLCGDQDNTACNAPDTCNGTGTCVDNKKAAGYVCQTGTGTCDPDHTCNGTTNTCNANYAASGTTCGDPDNTACNAPDTCNGTGTCVDNKKAAGYVCQTGTGTCDPDHTCNGTTNTCNANYATSGTACGDPSSTECDNPDSCDGSGTCLANHEPDGTNCGDAGTECTNQDTCLSGVCHDNGFKPASTHCTGSSQGGDCDNDAKDHCTGTSNTCVDVFKPAGTACNDEGNPCTVDQCSGTSGACQHTGPTSCSAVSDSSLCPFDVDNSAVGDQFRLILTPDQSASVYKLNASNPGQFYYNVFDGSGTGNPIVIDIPYPFVTKGAVPIHIYEQAPLDDNGCLLPGNEVTGCTITTAGGNLSGSGAPVILLGDYESGTAGTVTTAEVTCPVPDSGFLYVNIHLDYGLKGTTGYSNSNSNVVNAANTTQVIIPNMATYTFGFGDGELLTDSDDVQSENVFKRDPGIGGLVLDSDGYPVPNAKVQIFQGISRSAAAAVVTDQDGWYMWQYKWTGKAASFTVKMTPPLPYAQTTQSQSVTLKANGFLVVPFTVPMP